MRRFAVVLVALSLVLAACQNPANPPKSYVVVNSAWQTVPVPKGVSRAVDGPTADFVAQYNATHTDDQLFVYAEGEVPPIEESPLVDAYIVRASTHVVLKEWHGYPRKDLVARRDDWKQEVALWTDPKEGAAELYIDNVPPAPAPIVDTRTDDEKYAIYFIDATGKIENETHCEKWEEQQYESRQHCFERMCYYWGLEAQSRNSYSGPLCPYRVISGRYYTEPKPEEPKPDNPPA